MTQHTHRGVRAVQHLVEHAPSSGGLALWARHEDVAATEPAGYRPGRGEALRALVRTDGRTLFYDPRFEALPLPEQAGRVAHAVLHVALCHAPRFEAMAARTGDADLELWNLCADAIVDSALSHLAWLELPRGGVRLEQLVNMLITPVGEPLVDAGQALLEWDVERLYAAIDDRRPPPASGGRRQDGPRAAKLRALGQGTPRDLQPAPGREGTPELAAEAAREWSERVKRAHAGDGLHSMLRTLLADLPQSRTPWEWALRTRLSRALADRPGLSWSRPARSILANQPHAARRGQRMPWEPGRTALVAVPRLVLVVDVSGSIDEGLIGRFAREVEAVVRRHRAAIALVLGDDRVRAERELPAAHRAPLRLAALLAAAFTGGGGTDFSPLLQAAEARAPDLIVVLTDLDGPAAFRPRAPVLWAVPQPHAANPVPFGRRLLLE
jgi:predicted metal-dependent peptidase